MAHQLKLEVVAEGVETDEQAGFLRRNQCDTAQGYLLSRPLAAAELHALLRKGRLRNERLPMDDSRPSLLIVDDERSVQTSLIRLLRQEGYVISTASSAAEALEVIARKRIDVILTDQQMPDMTGTVLLSKVKSMYPDTIRIVLSGYADVATVAAAINDGAAYKFLMKPWDGDELKATLRHAFSRQIGKHFELPKDGRDVEANVTARTN